MDNAEEGGGQGKGKAAMGGVQLPEIFISALYNGGKGQGVEVDDAEEGGGQGKLCSGHFHKHLECLGRWRGGRRRKTAGREEGGGRRDTCARARREPGGGTAASI